jgi:hypothetical protein
MSIFQTSVIYGKKSRFGKDMGYNNQPFFCPMVYAKDGFHVSIQIQDSNCCRSENGFRVLGHTMQEAEFGFPSEDDTLLHTYSNYYGRGGYDDDGNDIPFDSSSFTSVGKNGMIPISVLEELFSKHGGIDWEKTISVEAFNEFTMNL